MIKNFDDLLKAVQNSPKVKVAVAAAEDTDIIDVSSRCLEIADFIFIGDAKKIEGLFREAGKKVSGDIIDIPDHAGAAAKAVELVKTGKAQNLMKGLLHTGVFLKAILNKETGLNRGNLISQISVYEKEDGLQLLTDCAINIKPELIEKKQILENAVELARALGIETPKAAILAAVELVNPDMPATVDAALLTVMAQHGQIKNCVVDGPLAFDNAIDIEAARHKGISGPVAGQADILVVPNIESGNMLSKALVFCAKKRTAAAIAGTGIPIIATSRAETVENKVLTVELALYLAQKAH
jgi:phosphate butyryltransferase